DFERFGAPKYAFLVNSGNIDSMVAHYTVARNRRNDDAYSPGKKAGLRPDRALIVYCNKIREVYKEVPIVIGGLEASLRRFAHYDYWQNAVRRSILEDTSANLLSYGMGERSMTEICTRLAAGEEISTITDVAGTCYISHDLPENAVICPSFEDVRKDKEAYARATKIQYEEQDPHTGHVLAQGHSKRWLIQNPPAAPLEREGLDKVYDYPYTRKYHPIYESMGGVPAILEVENSIIQNRGCFGGCNFCAITFHQGRAVTSRSKDSIVREAKQITESPNFKGYIHDVGGPTANFRFASCGKKSMCKDRKCLAPEPCKALKVSHEEYLDILRTLRKLPKVKKVFVRSGIRYDYLMLDKDDTFFRDLVQHHISGQLKVAPEHCSDRVLKHMGKPPFRYYKAFTDKYHALNKEYGKNQYLVPYLMSSHPGCTLKDAIELALYLKKINYHPEQVQDFYPTPGTVSTCMFYTGLDPFTMQPVYVPRTSKEKAYQRALLQYHMPQNRALVREALIKAGRQDLIRILR
ncbi:MAG: YgiQ family radical SAM protein, partial [Clostridia bacterium]|nr:YgiQ family radical SAM protein [Clostridia bacterium]